MRECRFFPWCSYIKDHGCTKDSCRHYQSMPDMEALLALADEMDKEAERKELACFDRSAATVGTRYVREISRRIREALGVGK